MEANRGVRSRISAAGQALEGDDRHTNLSALLGDCSFTGVFVQSRSYSTAKVCATCSYQTMICWRFLL